MAKHSPSYLFHLIDDGFDVDAFLRRTWPSFLHPIDDGFDVDAFVYVFLRSVAAPNVF